MSNYLGHLAFGYLLLGIAYLAQIRYYINLGLPTQIVQILGILAIVGIFSLIPDIDVQSSVASKWLIRIGLIAIAFFAYKMQNWIVISIAGIMLIVSTLKHRGVTHCLIASLVFAIPLLFLGWYFYLIGVLAFCSHLLIDGEMKVLPRKV